MLLAADAAHVAEAHDADARAEGLALLHRMAREDDGTVLPLARQDVPHTAARHRVHSTRRFVKEDYRRRADQRDGERELALVAARVGARGLIRMGRKRDLLEQLGNERARLMGWDALEPREHPQGLPPRHELEQRVELGTVAEPLAHLIELSHHVEAADARLAAAREDVAGQHGHRRSLSRAVGTQ